MNVKLTRHLGRLKVDINGKLYGETEFTGSVRTNSASPALGKDVDSSDRALRGRVAGLHIYDKALSENEIKNLTPNKALSGAVVAYSFS